MTTPRPRPEILTISPYIGGESTLPGINRTIKLSSNEGAFGVPPGAQQAIRRAAEDVSRYPDGGAGALREAIGRRWGLDPARIVCGAGSDDLIYQLCLAYGGPGRDIVMSAHGFAIYHIAGIYAGSRVIKVAERNLAADVDAMLATVSPSTRLMFLANPNNPTGSMLPSSEVTRLRRELAPEVLLVIDSAYAEYVTRRDYEPGVKLVDATDNTVMTRTFSKVFGLGGMRIGWCYAPPEVVDVLNRVPRRQRRLRLWPSRVGSRGVATTMPNGGRSSRRGCRRPASRSGRARATSCWPISVRQRSPRRPTHSCADAASSCAVWAATACRTVCASLWGWPRKSRRWSAD
jgi:histidinol-phosphate aminotransferase